MSCVPLVLAALLSLVPSRLDAGDTPTERRALYTPVAEAICLATAVRWERAWLVADGEGETHYARFVLEERCQDGPRGERCDWNPRLNAPEAHGPWQVWLRWCPGCRKGATRLARYVAGAKQALRIARRGRMKCGTWEGSFAHQLGGGRCLGGAERLPTFYRVLALLKEAERE